MTPRTTALVWVLTGCVAFAGCALPQKQWGKGATGGALAGAAVGGGAGAGVGAAIGDDDDAAAMGRDAAIGAAIGLVVGGLVGHYLFDEDLVPPAPVEAPPPTEEEPAPEALGDVVAVVDVSQFGFDQYQIPQSAFAELDALAAKLNQRPGLQVVLEGHTDNVGSVSYNLELGLRRAEAVRAYLASHGVAAARMSARSKGMSVPVASNDTPEGRAKNRRVEVRTLGGDVPAGEGAPPSGLMPPAPELQQASPGEAIERVVLFAPAESLDLDPRAVQTLDNVVDYLTAHPAATVSVTGYCDGVVETNRVTAIVRADRVRSYLVGRGIDVQRISVDSVIGPVDPQQSDDAALALNRRVVLVVRSSE